MAMRTSAMPFSRWQTPALVVAAGCLIALIPFGVRSSFGLFTEPMTAAHGWSIEAFALAIAIQNLLWGAGQPVAGAIADRYGAGRVLAGGGLLYILGLGGMATTSDPLALQLTAGVLIGLGLSGSSFMLVISAISRMVPSRWRSSAVGAATASGSLGQFLCAPLGQAFIDIYGWQIALWIFAGAMVLVPFLAVVLAGRPKPTPDLAETDIDMRTALTAAFGHGSYWLLIAGFFVCGFHVAFITVHLPPYLTSVGISAKLAAWAIGLIGLGNIIGAFLSGILGGRYSKRWLLTALYAARAVTITAFILAPSSEASVLLFAVVMGLLWLSTVPLTSGLVSVMFGVRYLGTLFGVVFFSHQVGAFIGIWLGGYLYEATGSYLLMWWIAIALGVFAAAVHAPIRERRAPAFAMPTLKVG